MKKIWLAVIGVVILASMVLLGGCATDNKINTGSDNQQTGIWVSATGKVYATPDIAQLTLGVEAQAVTVAEAQSNANEAMNAVIAALKAKGVADADIQTQYFSIQQVTRYDKDKQEEVVVGYRVSNTVVAKLRAIDKVGSTIDSVAAAAGDLARVNGIQFSVDQPEKYYSQAREKAVADAKQKAEQMAALTGVTLQKPTLVTESQYNPAPPYPIAMDKVMAAGAVPSTPISAGETDIIVNVQIVYAVQ